MSKHNTPLSSKKRQSVSATPTTRRTPLIKDRTNQLQQSQQQQIDDVEEEQEFETDRERQRRSRSVHAGANLVMMIPATQDENAPAVSQAPHHFSRRSSLAQVQPSSPTLTMRNLINKKDKTRQVVLPQQDEEDISNAEDEDRINEPTKPRAAVEVPLPFEEDVSFFNNFFFEVRFR